MSALSNLNTSFGFSDKVTLHHNMAFGEADRKIDSALLQINIGSTCFSVLIYWQSLVHAGLEVDDGMSEELHVGAQVLGTDLTSSGHFDRPAPAALLLS